MTATATVMIGISTVVANLAYLIGAVVLIVILVVAYALRHRRPKSLEANVESFNRGLKALSPDASPRKGRRRNPAAEMTGRRPSRAHTVRPAGRDVPAAAATDHTEAETG